MTLDVSKIAKDCLSEKGYDFRYGARYVMYILLVQKLFHILSLMFNSFFATYTGH